MAVIENDTLHYYRVLKDESFIHNNMTFIAVKIYQSAHERAKEKNRLNELDMFTAKCNNLLNQLKTSNNQIYIELEPIMHKIRKCVLDNNCEEIYFSNDIYGLLIECGFNINWLTEPIHVISKSIINAGINNCKTIENEELYLKLKDVMAGNIVDA